MKTARICAPRGRATVAFLEVLKWRIEASLSGVRRRRGVFTFHEDGRLSSITTSLTVSFNLSDWPFIIVDLKSAAR
jgi:hypothetical protein